MKKAFILVGLTTLNLLSGCQLLQNPEDHHRALCRELKTRMTFNGQDARPSVAFRERSEQGKLAQSYRDEGCM